MKFASDRKCKHLFEVFLLFGGESGSQNPMKPVSVEPCLPTIRARTLKFKRDHRNRHILFENDMTEPPQPPTAQSNQLGRKRPPMLRAMGTQDPPAEIVVAGRVFRFVENYKHDTWAATSLYVDDSGHKIVCKINRYGWLFGIPTRCLGRWLARRELGFLESLAGVTGIPRAYRVDSVNGKCLTTAAAHDFVEGKPLSQLTEVPLQFFERLRELLGELHSRGIAYVDLHKHENILVGDDGNPHLVDFQISFRKPRIWGCGWLFRVMAQSDLYHWDKIQRRWGNPNWELVPIQRPWWIRAHRMIANPYRVFRRRLLVWLGVRRGKGEARTEVGCEVGLRQSN